MLNLHEKYGLRRVLNAYDKATHLGGARVVGPIRDVVTACLGEAFQLADLQELAGGRIAHYTGAEWGCVTACAAAGITLGVAACMAGTDRQKIACLPDVSTMKGKVLLQRGHAISFGAPVSQMIRLSGASLVEVGTPERCSAGEMIDALQQPGIAAVVAVESYHTANYAGVGLAELAQLAHDAGVPLVVDGATQELRLRELVNMGPDLVICSAHKYFAAPTAGVVAGRRDLVDGVLAQSVGIGRGMKVGKEGILGVVAALDEATDDARQRWCTAEAMKVEAAMAQLSGAPGLLVERSPDPNGCPFERIRIEIVAPDPVEAAHEARVRLAQRDPAIHVRIYGAERNAFYLNFTELTPDEVEDVCAAILAECTS